MDNNKTVYNVIIGRDSCGDILVLDYAFHYDDTFHGVMGSRFYAVPKAEYKESMKRDNIVDSLMGCDCCETKAQAIKMYQDMKYMGELESFVFDLSYSELHDDMRKAFGLNEKNYPIITCTGGGRMFNIRKLAELTDIKCDGHYLDIIFNAEDMDKEFMDYMTKGFPPQNESMMKARIYAECMKYKDSKA